MTTTVTPNLKPDHSQREGWPAPERELADTTPAEPPVPSWDPTQGRRVGSRPYDDVTQGRKLGSDPYDDVTRAR